jgi:hypothetical protein
MCLSGDGRIMMMCCRVGSDIRVVVVVKSGRVAM